MGFRRSWVEATVADAAAAVNPPRRRVHGPSRERVGRAAHRLRAARLVVWLVVWLAVWLAVPIGERLGLSAPKDDSERLAVPRTWRAGIVRLRGSPQPAGERGRGGACAHIPCR